MSRHHPDFGGHSCQCERWTVTILKNSRFFILYSGDFWKNLISVRLVDMKKYSIYFKFLMMIYVELVISFLLVYVGYFLILSGGGKTNLIIRKKKNINCLKCSDLKFRTHFTKIIKEIRQFNNFWVIYIYIYI